ncbi:MAG: transcriptional repressor [Firmicutes bacterium]|nr:transcriptional repressor [Bacillota bacterium]
MNYSRQRNIISEIVKSSYEHPTAEEIYALAVKELPTIGIATVYRNLNQLEEMGELRRIPITEGSDRFDGHMEEHYHMVCKTCGRLTDLRTDDASISAIKESVCNAFKIKASDVELAPILIEGICGQCIKAKKRKS